MNKLWAGVLFGLAVSLSGMIKITTGQSGSLWGGSVPTWTGWLLLPGGLLILVLSIRGLLRSEGKPPCYTDDDVEKSKRHLEQMYIKEHGVPPEYPENSQK